MGLLDMLTPHAHETPPDYEAGGAQPSKEHGGHLADRRVEQSQRTADAADAAELLRHLPPAEPPPVIELTRPVGNDEWEPIFMSIPLGQAVEVLGRDELRDTFDVTNQSAALLGKACSVFLFRRETDAQKLANATAAQRAQVLRSTLRAIALPDGAGRTMTHTAPVYAVAVDTAGSGATDALLDVSPERRRQAKP